MKSFMRALHLCGFGIVVLNLFLFTGCASSPYVFGPAEPVQQRNDQNPTAVPAGEDFIMREYMIKSAVRYPIVNSLETRRIPRSKDVNALDQLPASSWYTPRLGAKALSPETIVKGPQDLGPPQSPLQVVKAKNTGSDTGFIVEDKRGLKYLLKFDEPGYFGWKSSTNFVVNRLFWAFGYHVPEDYVIHFRRSDISVQPGLDYTNDKLDETLLFVELDENSRFRATASLFIQGQVVGHTAQKGMRADDPNDNLPHEDLRSLRALYVFCALTQQTGIRSDNTLDVYHGAPGQGFVRHYLLDFGEAFGIHAHGYDRPWEGYQHFFSADETTENYLGMGFKVKDWEKIDEQAPGLQTYYEAEAFDPATWKEAWQFEPIRKSQPDDNYWAAKVIGALTQAQLDALFEAAGYPDATLANDLKRTLLARREKLMHFAFERVTPLESSGVQNGKLQLEDTSIRLLNQADPAWYEIRFYGTSRKEIAGKVMLENHEVHFEVSLPDVRGDYLRVEVLKLRGGGNLPEPAEFHLRRDASGSFRLAGIIH